MTSRTQQQRSPQKRSTETQTAILKASLSVFAQFGFEGASTRFIAEQAGVNHNLIRHHFGNKEELWKATAAAVFERYSERIRQRLQGLEGVDVPTQTKLLLKEFILFSAETPEFHRFMMQANQSDPNRLIWLVRSFLLQGSEQEIELFQVAQDADIFVEGNSGLLRYMFIGAATSIFTFAAEFAQITGNDAFDPAIIDEHIDLVLKVFCKENL